MADGNGFFSHPFQGCSSRWKVADVITESSILNDSGCSHEEPAVVYAGTHVKNRRNSNCPSNRGKTGACIDIGRFRGKKASLSAGHGTATRGQNDHVVFDQFLDQGEIGVIVGHTGVVAANHACNPPNPAVDVV